MKKTLAALVASAFLLGAPAIAATTPAPKASAKPAVKSMKSSTAVKPAAKTSPKASAKPTTK